MTQWNNIFVLHVDDEPDITKLTATFLEREDARISVQTATSVDEGLKHLAESEIDCIVSDYQMPGMNGIEFLETVREDHPNLPFILYTGKGSEEVASQAISSGVTDYLQKETGTDDFTLLANRIVNGVESQRHEQRHKFLEALENQLTELAIEFLQTEYRDIDTLIDEGLETLGKLVEADRSYVFDVDYEAETLSNTHEWCGEGVEPQMDMLQELPLDTLSWWMQKLENFENILIPNVSELPPEAETEQEILQEQNIASLIVTPMISNGELVGFIGFDWVTEQEAWSDEFIDVLRLTSELITTARRREARRRELERHEAYLQQSQDFITVVDDDGTVQFQSDSVEEITTYRPPEIMGESGFEYVHPEDRQNVTELFTSILGSPGETATAELRVETKEGSWRWVEARGVNKLDDPVIEGIITSSRDITERKEREQELERYETIVEATGDPVYTLDEDGYITYINEAVLQLSGYGRDELLGSHATKVMSAEHFERGTDLIQRLLSSDQNHGTFEMDLVTADGDRIPCEIHVALLPSEDESIGSVGVIRDITERKEREQELKARKEDLEELTDEFETQYRHLFEEAPVMAVLTRAEDGEPIIEESNQLFLDTLGYDRSAVIGEELASFYTPESTAALLEEGGYDRALAGEFVREERKLVTVDGETVETLLRAVPRRDADDTISGTLAMYIDITERKQLERKTERLEEFTRIVSHDLRNPLNVAEGRLELAREECDSEHLDAVADAHERMTALIEDLLMLARQGKSVGDTDAVNLGELLDNCWHNVETADATIRILIDRTIRADRSRLKQLLENLIRNAVEHGGDDVTVTVGGIDERGFYVEDDGPGIPEEDRDTVFDPGHTTVEDGTGFGLSIVQRIAEAHGWDIRVTDGTDGGARFEITGFELAA